MWRLFKKKYGWAIEIWLSFRTKRKWFDWVRWNPTSSFLPGASVSTQHYSAQLSLNWGKKVILQMSTRRDKEGVEKSLEEPKLSRTSSLIKRTKHLSLKMRRHGEKPAEQIPDDSDCVISWRWKQTCLFFVEKCDVVRRFIYLFILSFHA